MRKVVFFDLDGTLLDTSYRHYKVYLDILSMYGIRKVLPKESFWAEKRKGKKTTELLPEPSNSELQKEFAKEWINRIEDKTYLVYDRLFEGTLNLLSVLETKADLVLVTLRNNKRNLFWELNRFGLLKYFKAVLVGNPLKMQNKTPLLKDYIEKHSKSSAKGKFILVGDSEVDISSSKKLEIPCVAVAWGIRSKEFLMKLQPNYCVETVSELQDILISELG